eukprot:5561672-Pleurochrysis_carterae.AAC.2
MPASEFYGTRTKRRQKCSWKRGERCLSCVRHTARESVVISKLRRSETGPSSSTLQRWVSAPTKSSYSEPLPSCVYSVNKSSTLRHAVNWFLNQAYTGPAIGADGGVPGRRVAVDDLVLLEIALHVRRDKIPSPHPHAGRTGDGGEGPQGRGPHRGAERLVVVHSVDLCAPLYTQAGFEGPATLALVDPDEPDERSTGWDLQAVDGGPTTVRGMISDLGAFSRIPADAVLSHGLLTCTRISGDVVDSEGAAGPAPPDALVFARSKSEQRRRAVRPQRVLAERTAKGFARAGMSSGCACDGGAMVSVTVRGGATAGVRSLECCGGCGEVGTALGSAGWG